MTSARIQLQSSDGVIAAGDGQIVRIFWPEAVSDDHLVVTLGRLFARTRGLELYRYDRAGMDRKSPDITRTPTKQVIEAARRVLDTDPHSFQVFLRPGVDYADEDLLPADFDHDLGGCWLVIPGVCDVRDTDQLGELLERLQGAEGDDR